VALPEAPVLWEPLPVVVAVFVAAVLPPVVAAGAPDVAKKIELMQDDWQDAYFWVSAWVPFP
jgi:hypothetical protein